MELQEKLLSLSEVTKDYSKGSQLTENPKFCLFTLSEREKKVWQNEKCSEGFILILSF